MVVSPWTGRLFRYAGIYVPPAPVKAGGTSFYGLRKEEGESAFQNDLMRKILPVKQEKNELSKKFKNYSKRY